MSTNNLPDFSLKNSSLDFNSEQLVISADSIANKYYDEEGAPKVEQKLLDILELEDKSKAADFLKKLDEGLAKDKYLEMRVFLKDVNINNIKVIHNLGFSNAEIFEMVLFGIISDLNSLYTQKHNFCQSFSRLIQKANPDYLFALLKVFSISKEEFICFNSRQLNWFHDISIKTDKKPEFILRFLKKNIQILQKELLLSREDLIKNLGNFNSSIDTTLLDCPSDWVQKNLDFYINVVGFEPQTIVRELQKYNLQFKSTQDHQKMYELMERVGLNSEEIKKVLIESEFKIFNDLSARIVPEYNTDEIPAEYIYGIKKMMLAKNGFKDIQIIHDFIMENRKTNPLFIKQKGLKLVRLYDFLGKITPELAKAWLEISDEDEEKFITEYEQKKTEILFANADETDGNNQNTILPNNAIYELIQNTYGAKSSDVEYNIKNLEDRTELPYKAEAKYDVTLSQYDQQFSKPVSDEAKNIIQTPFKKANEQPVLFQLLTMYGDFRLSKYTSQYSENGEITPSQVKELQEIISIIPKEEEFLSFISGLNSSSKKSEKRQDLIKNVHEFLLPENKNPLKNLVNNTENNPEAISLALNLLEQNDTQQLAVFLVTQSSIADLAKDIQFEAGMLEKTRASKIQTLKNRLIIQQAKEDLKQGKNPDYQNLLPVICSQQSQEYQKKLAQSLSQIKRVKLLDQTINFVPTVSKAGFFAKYSAEICTADNTEMYEKRYHSHLNIIAGDKVVGNVMLYMFDETERPELSNYLVARGFNPSNDFLRSVNPAQFTDEIVKILTDIAQKNNKTAILVPQQDGWHALANRDLMASAVQKICSQCDQEGSENLRLDVNEHGVETPLQFLKKGI